MATQFVQNDSASVGTTSTEILHNVMGNQKRIEFAITNTSSTQDIYLFIGNIAAVSGAGIKLTPNYSFIQSTDAGSQCWQGPVQAISSAAGGSIAIMQRVENVQ